MSRTRNSIEEVYGRDIAGAEPAAFPWWLVLLQGVAALVIGFLLITNPAVTVLTLVVFLGVYWLIGGVLDLVSIFVDHAGWGWRLFTGVLGVIAGLLIVRNPLWAGIAVPATLVYLLAIIGVIVGGAGLVRAFTGGGWGAGLVGILSIVLGIFLLMRPLVSLQFLVYLIGFWAIAGGIATIVGAFLLRRASVRPQLSGPAGWLL
jgi:uncharacterized membrane protein HdeD (DUF308 family)